MSMNEKVIEALKRYSYRVLTDKQDLERIYNLRYKCYRAESSIAANENRIMTDPFDETENCVHVAVEEGGELLAAVRLHLVSPLSLVSPTLEVFPEVLDDLKSGQTILDPTRLVVNPAARAQRVPLHFLAVRIPCLATVFYNVDLVLAPVRPEHAAFYRRYLRHEVAIGPRSYPGLKKPVLLMTAKAQEQRAAVLARTPFFGPVPEIPSSDIAFPSLSGVYVASKGKGTEAA